MDNDTLPSGCALPRVFKLTTHPAAIEPTRGGNRTVSLGPSRRLLNSHKTLAIEHRSNIDIFHISFQ
jgi:hypothetical protein